MPKVTRAALNAFWIVYDTDGCDELHTSRWFRTSVEAGRKGGGHGTRAYESGRRTAWPFV